MTRAQQTVFVCLVGLAAALVFVGFVSSTVLRHVVQIAPVVVAAVIVARRPSAGAYTAVPIFVFWIGIVVLIWLFLLGVSTIARGHYTVAEIIATIVMAGVSLIGLATSVRLGRPLSMDRRAVAVIGFAALQLGAMWVSLLPQIRAR